MNLTKEIETPEFPKNINDLDDMILALWEKYFNSSSPLTATERKEVRDEYNRAAEYRNKLSGFKCFITLTASTRIEKRPEQEKVEIVKSLSSKPVYTRAPRETSSGGKIQQIINLFISGRTKKEIVAAGFNQSTVNRQISEYVKRTSK